MKNIKLKIFNLEVIDCSSSWNEVVPNPESRELLLDIFLKLCESEAISLITSVMLELDFIGSSNIFVEHHTDIKFQSPGAYGFLTDSRSFPFSNYQIQKDALAKENKIEGLFIESEKLAIEKIKEWSHLTEYQTYLIPPGLKGIKRAISIVKAYYSENYQNIPTQLPKKHLKSFSLGAGVLWKAWIKYIDDKDFGEIVDYKSASLIGDNISANSQDMILHLGGICLGGEQGRKYGDKHFVDIQKVLDKYWPDIYLVKEQGECAAPADGKKAIRRYLDGENLEEFNYWDNEQFDY